jgi:WD40 repeat protein
MEGFSEELSFLVSRSGTHFALDFGKRVDVQPARRAKEPGKMSRISVGGRGDCFVLTCSQFAILFTASGNIDAFHFNGFPCCSAVLSSSVVVVGFALSGLVLQVEPQVKLFEDAALGSVIGLHGEDESCWAGFASGTVMKLEGGSSGTVVVPSGGMKSKCTAMAVCSSFLALCHSSGECVLHNRVSGERIASFQSYFGAFVSVCVSPDGKFVAAGGEDDLVSVFCVESQALVLRLLGCSSAVLSLSFRPEKPNYQLVAACEGKIVFFEFDQTDCIPCSVVTKVVLPLLFKTIPECLFQNKVRSMQPIGEFGRFGQKVQDVLWRKDVLVLAMSDGSAIVYNVKDM